MVLVMMLIMIGMQNDVAVIDTLTFMLIRHIQYSSLYLLR